MEVVLRAEAVERVQAGDKCDFIGTLIVVPDVSQLRTEGELGSHCDGVVGGVTFLITLKALLEWRLPQE